jgi:SpoVK/Ycf46/Vps4 family AAA+-type ATPase
MRNNRYDLSDTSYIQKQDEKVTRFTNLLREAESIRLDNKGEPTEQEAEVYGRAGKICEEIMALNLSQPAVYDQWKMRKTICLERLTEIRDALAPPAPVVEPTPDSGKNVNYNAPKFSGSTAKRGEVKTKSGFKTRNACSDVSAETIESWHKKQVDHDFSHVKGNEKLKRRLLNEAASIGWNRVDAELKISPVQSYFFYGPPGTGKSFIIEAFAGELMKKGFSFIQLRGSDIHASHVGVAEKTVQIAFEEAVDNAPCLIFIDEIENVCVGRGNKAEGHEKRLTVAFLEAYNHIKSSNKRVIFMGATNYPGQVDNAMLDRIKLIKIPLPSEELRADYFKGSLGNLQLAEGFTVADMASETDNYSFRDMSRLKESIVSELKDQAITTYAIQDKNGELDQKATDIRISEAIRSGEIKLTRSLFEQMQQENPPSDKTEIRQQLQEFENNIKKMG